MGDRAFHRQDRATACNYGLPTSSYKRPTSHALDHGAVTGDRVADRAIHVQ